MNATQTIVIATVVAALAAVVPTANAEQYEQCVPAEPAGSGWICAGTTFGPCEESTGPEWYGIKCETGPTYVESRP